jgi:hypothetical protein
MKKTLLVLTLFLTLTMTACGQKAGDLMQNASPETSALALYTWDGETAESQLLYDTAQEEQLLDILNALPAKKLETYTVADGPIYALEIGDTEGTLVTALWCDGVWITASGDAYAVDLPVETLLTDYDWEDRDTVSLQIIPNIRFLATDGTTWNTAYLTPASDMTPPDGVTLTADAVDGDIVTASFSNDGSEEFIYGYYYGLQAQVDGQWYNVPVAENFGVIDLASMLPAGSTRQETYNLSFYGDVPDGTYRLAAENLTVPLTRQNGAWQLP